LILLPPGIQFKAVEGDALATDADFPDKGPDFGVEAVAVHTEVAGRIPESEHSRHKGVAASSASRVLMRVGRNRHRAIVVVGYGSG
jgi:hypothetical protein